MNARLYPKCGWPRRGASSVGSATSRWWLATGSGSKKCCERKTSGAPGSPSTFTRLAKVCSSAAEAWQLTQYCPKPMNGYRLVASGGQSGLHPLQPNQPQNQPSCEAPRARTITAAPLVGSRRSGSTPAQAAAGAGNISLTIIAPSGIGGGAAGAAAGSLAGRLASSHATISGEYQTTTGACVPR